jgi:hypothetical protein
MSWLSYRCSLLVLFCAGAVEVAALPVPELNLALNQSMLAILYAVPSSGAFTSKLGIYYDSSGQAAVPVFASHVTASMGGKSLSQLHTLYQQAKYDVQQQLASPFYPYDGIEAVDFYYAIRGQGDTIQCKPAFFAPPYGSQTFTQVDIQINANADGSCEVIAKGS